MCGIIHTTKKGAFGAHSSRRNTSRSDALMELTRALSAWITLAAAAASDETENEEEVREEEEEEDTAATDDCDNSRIFR